MTSLPIDNVQVLLDSHPNDDTRLTYISLLERGLKSPTLTTFFQLCQILDQQPDILIAQINAQLTQKTQSQKQKNE